MATMGRWPSSCCSYFFALLVLLLLMVPVHPRTIDDGVEPEDSPLPTIPRHECKVLWVAKCQDGLANEPCCKAINSQIERHSNGFSCVCDKLNPKGHYSLPQRCIKEWCPSCKGKTCNISRLAEDEAELKV